MSRITRILLTVILCESSASEPLPETVWEHSLPADILAECSMPSNQKRRRQP